MAFEVFVVGARTWTDADVIRAELDALPRDRAIRVVSFGQRGAEQLALRDAEQRNWVTTTCEPWAAFGKTKPNFRKRIAEQFRRCRPHAILIFNRTHSRQIRQAIAAAEAYGADPASRLERTRIVNHADAELRMRANDPSTQ